jgi:acyl-coenzyme A thioesterase PaaI-like protein
VEQRGGPELGGLVAALRLVQDRVTGTAAPADVLAAATRSLLQTAELLAEHVAADGDQHAGYRLDLPGRGHPLLAPFVSEALEDDRVDGRITFTRTHLSGAGRVHAGAVALLFGEVLGVLSVLGGRSPSRNAALHINYRKPTPADVELRLTGTVTRVDGRKVYVNGELRLGETILADAEGLYVRVTDAPEG